MGQEKSREKGGEEEKGMVVEWQKKRKVGEREGEHYIESALTNQPHSLWSRVNVITVHTPHQSLVHAPLHLVKQMSWSL